MSLQGKKIILGISASIAAYKSIQLVRLLTKEGAEVRVVQTKAALDNYIQLAPPQQLEVVRNNK